MSTITSWPQGTSPSPLDKSARSWQIAGTEFIARTPRPGRFALT